MLKRKFRKTQAKAVPVQASVPGSTVIGVYPHARRNPFQRMLYAAPGDRAVEIAMLDKPEDLSALAAGRPAIAHYHWVHSLFDGIKGPRVAQKAARAFIAGLDRQRDEGTGIVWTIHNILSHRRRFLDEELLVREALAERADVLHVMNPDTLALTASYYALDPAKTRHVPHPSYHGVYPAYQARSVARQSLGLREGDIAFLAFGMIEPYKGLRPFLASLDALQDALGGRAKALVAGRPSNKELLAELENMVRNRNDVIIEAEAVDDQSVQSWFKAADVVMCPYPVALNSGVAQTAMSFGKPVVISANLVPTLPAVEGAVSVFDPDRSETLVAAAQAAANAAMRPELGAELLDWSSRLAPESVSGRFFTMLETSGLLPSSKETGGKT